MQTAIATVCLSGTLNEKLEAIAAARFKGVEIFENDLLSFDGAPAEVGRLIKDLGLAAVTFQPFRDFEGMPEPWRAKVFSRAERSTRVLIRCGRTTKSRPRIGNRLDRHNSSGRRGAKCLWLRGQLA